MSKKMGILAAIGIVLVAVAAWYFWPSSSPIPSDRQFVNVLTGQVVTLRKDKIISIPEVDNDGRRVLYPITRNDDGATVIDPRFQQHLRNQIGNGAIQESELRIDPQSFVIQR